MVNSRLNSKINYNNIICKSEAYEKVLQKVEQVSPTDTTVLITGESGTGKELLASAIHSNSLRKDRPLIKINCATLPKELIESELFGHVKGSFTGAGEAAEGGAMDAVDNTSHGSADLGAVGAGGASAPPYT